MVCRFFAEGEGSAHRALGLAARHASRPRFCVGAKTPPRCRAFVPRRLVRAAKRTKNRIKRCCQKATCRKSLENKLLGHIEHKNVAENQQKGVPFRSPRFRLVPFGSVSCRSVPFRSVWCRLVPFGAPWSSGVGWVALSSEGTGSARCAEPPPSAENLRTLRVRGRTCTLYSLRCWDGPPARSQTNHTEV